MTRLQQLINLNNIMIGTAPMITKRSKLSVMRQLGVIAKRSIILSVLPIARNLHEWAVAVDDAEEDLMGFTTIASNIGLSSSL